MTPRRRGRILLADDSLVGQKISVRMLEQLGYQVDVVADGREAVRAAGAGLYDIVLMDCEMPVMDGYEATMEIRRAEGGNRRTPIIAMTGSEGSRDVEKALAAGMDAHISKPVAIEDLAAILEGAPPGTRSEPAHTTSDGPALDPEVIANLKELNGETGTFFTEFMDAFLTGTEERFDELRRALSLEGWQGPTAALVHAIKGSCGSAGAIACARICREIEEALEGGDRGRVTVLVAVLGTELARVRAELADGSDALTHPETDARGSR